MSRIRLLVAVLITVLGAALAATAGAQGSMAVAMQQGTAAGFSAIAANTTSNTLANNGNLGRGVKDTFNKNGTKSILASTLTSGATGGISDATGIGMDAKTLKPVNTTDLASRAKYAAIHTATKTTADVAIQNKSFASAFTDNLRSNAATQLQATL